MKHGPIALIDGSVPVVALLPYDRSFQKMISNIEEICARSGQVLLLAGQQGSERIGNRVRWTIPLPAVDATFYPILYALPMQLLAYHTAVHKGTDVDQPRNLAKSVTVE